MPKIQSTFQTILPVLEHWLKLTHAIAMKDETTVCKSKFFLINQMICSSKKISGVLEIIIVTTIYSNLRINLKIIIEDCNIHETVLYGIWILLKVAKSTSKTYYFEQRKTMSSTKLLQLHQPSNINKYFLTFPNITDEKAKMQVMTTTTIITMIIHDRSGIHQK